MNFRCLHFWSRVWESNPSIIITNDNFSSENSATTIKWSGVSGSNRREQLGRMSCQHYINPALYLERKTRFELATISSRCLEGIFLTTRTFRSKFLLYKNGGEQRTRIANLSVLTIQQIAPRTPDGFTLHLFLENPEEAKGFEPLKPFSPVVFKTISSTYRITST